MSANGIEKALFAEPQNEPSLRVVLGQAGRCEYDREQRKADARAPGAKDPGGGETASELLTAGLELAEVSLKVVGQVNQTARASVIRELSIRPERFENADKVRLAAAVETRDPCGRLRRLVEVCQVAAQNAIEAGRVFAFSNEGLEFIPQDGPLLVRTRLPDLGYAEVRNRPGGRVAGQDITDQSHRELPSGIVIG